MIDVSPFLQRLEWLKEWMAGVIDGRIFPFHFNLSGLVEYNPSDIIRVYMQTGVLYQRTEPIEPQPIHMTFDEYCNYKQSLSKTNQQ